MIQLLCLNYIVDKKDGDFILSNNIDSTYFSDYEREFLFIYNHINTYGVVPDRAVLLSAFPKFELITVTDSKEFLLKELQRDRTKRQIARVFNKVAQCINSDDVDGALAEYSKEYSSLFNSSGLQAVDLFKDTSRYNSYVEKSENYANYFVTTGFKELDGLLGGWDRREDLVSIVGRTGQGKTWLMLKTAMSAAKQGLRVGIYSGEMSQNKVGYRLDTLMSHISNGRIIHGDRGIQNEYKRFLDNLSNEKGTIIVITPQMIGSQATVSTLRSFISKYKLDILCVDQHSLMDDERHGKSITERAANISKDLKNLQTMAQIPIIAVAQQNRESTENGVGTQHIGLTDRIGQDSTVVIMFDKEDGVLTMTLTKARDAGDGKKLKYAIDLDKGVFNYLPNEDDALRGSDSEELRKEYEYDDGENPF